MSWITISLISVAVIWGASALGMLWAYLYSNELVDDDLDI
jgi:hypothetical protein